MGKTKKTDLSVRQLCDKDIVSYLRIARRSDIGKFVSFLSADSLDEARQLIQKISDRRYEKLYGLFVKSRLVAVFDLTTTLDENGVVVHYFVGKKFRGNNYASTGILMLFDMLDFEYFRFEVNEMNKSSQRVQQKLGSRLSGFSNGYFTYNLCF